jgi:uncharacterized protein (TIGR02266 family)
MTAQHQILITAALEPSLKIDREFSARENFCLSIAADGLEAWEFIRRRRPDLVFMDLHARGLAGDECCRRVRKDPQLKDLPLVLVVDRQSREDLACCLKADCTDIIFMPFSNHLLLSTARRLLGLAYRSFPRIATRLIIRYGLEPKNMHHGFSSNLSSGGMFIETENPFLPGQELFLEFSLPNTRQPVLCKSFVAWHNPSDQSVNPGMPPGMGVQFLSLSLPDMLSIWDYFSHLDDSLSGPRPAVPARKGSAGKAK